MAGLSEPTPPVTARAFPIEASGVVPSDGDGRIPNPATPDGAPWRQAPPCTTTVTAGPAGGSAAVNRLVAATENRMTRSLAICLAGTFRSPLKIWGKYSPALLTIEPAPRAFATLAVGAVQASDVSPNEYDGVAGAVSIVDSRGVQIRGLTITGYHTEGTTETPAGIYVEERANGFGGRPSVCFTQGDHACADIYLIDNRITHIANLADTVANRRTWCNNGSVDAFGIEVESYGRGAAGALQHVAVVGNEILDTRTGQSETLAVNGDVKDFLVAGNRIRNTDNIGIDTEGWYDGTAQANHGLVLDNLVANVDTWSNRAYGVWNPSTGTCQPLSPNAAGIYDDGAAYIWIAGNVVANTDQGISLDTETPHHFTNDILVSHNRVWDGPGTRLGDPSFGPNPPGVPGRSQVSGHAYDAFYVDAFGPGSRIFDVYAYDNVFMNASRYFGGRRRHHVDVVDFGGQWSHVVLWDNTVIGGGAADPWGFALGVDNWPTTKAGTAINCTWYRSLSSVNPNFSVPGATYQTLRAWQKGNGAGWDSLSTVSGPPACPQAIP